MSAQFSLQVADWIKKAQMKEDLVIQDVVTALAADIVMNTPVDTGILRGAWQIGIGTIPTTTPFRLDKSGLGTLQSINGDALKIKAGDVVYLANNVVYAGMVEFGGWAPPKFTPGVPHKDRRPGMKGVMSIRTNPTGYSIQAPTGMVRTAIARISAAFEQRVAQL